ncbi:hypothetical protein KEM55_003155 [Ascosphaera atra]|nr:hypothetical protein KEM55_003155 [Ascosphaera atra]
MKQRFSSLDVKVIARELAQSIIGLRIANIYDLSTRICLFKLQQPDIRKQLIIDPGFRCHLSEYARTAADTPSPFIARLRKFLKTRRITNVSQVGTDRVIHFEISDGQFHLFLEFFAAGNVILTDAEFKIVALLRIVPEAAGQEEVKLGLQYNLASKQNYNGVPDISEERLRGALDKAVAAANEEQQQPEEGAKKKKKKSKTIAALRRALSSEFPEFPPLLLDHAFHVAAFDSSIAPSQVQSDPALFTHIKGYDG